MSKIQLTWCSQHEKLQRNKDNKAEVIKRLMDALAPPLQSHV